MMTSIRRQTGSLELLHFLLGVCLVCPKRSVSLELHPSASDLLLQSHSNLTLVCSGWSQLTWRLPESSDEGGVIMDNQGSSSTLQLFNVTWRNSGRYTCEEASIDQNRGVNVFIPGEGPSEWFIPVRSGVVMKETEEDTVPCVVSDPKLNVSLVERVSRNRVTEVTYEPARGFKGRLNDTSYVCVASNGAQVEESQVFYVFSVVVSKDMDVDLSVSSQVLRQGDVLTVNCTVKDIDVVFFSWDFPRRQEVEPVTDFLPNQMRSFINITKATIEDSGVYVCEVEDRRQGQTVKKNITIKVLDGGYVYLWPSGETNLSSLLRHTVELKVEADAHPSPTITWTRNNQTVITSPASINTTHLMGSRYVSTLILAEVQMGDTGSYKVTAANEDDADEVVFYLEVTASPKILSLAEVGSNAVQCVTEGAPPSSVSWYTCFSSHRCVHLNGSWKKLSAASEGVAFQETVVKVTEEGMTQVRSVLTLDALSSVTAVRCEATNSAGGRARDLRVLTQSLLSQVSVLVVVLVLVAVAAVFIIILIVLWRKKPPYEVSWKLIGSVSSDGQQVTYMDPEDLPYSSAWEIPRDHVVPGPVVGSGPFGRVVEATVSGLTHPHSTTKAVVKMADKRRSDVVQSLVSEMKILTHLGPHLNLVNLLGVCSKGGPFSLITEFCCHGDLLSFLKRNKQNFQRDVPIRSDSDGGYMDMTTGLRGQNIPLTELPDADLQPAVEETMSTLTDQQAAPLLLLRDLISFSFQVAQAMDFLSSKQCVHRDLAARNVLVSEGNLVKICDFGITRDLQNDPNYIFRRNSFQPLKWMSPESIFHNVYSAKSDAWSYGVLLWEIFSLGGSPYPDLPMTRLVSALKSGKRMDQPEHSPPEMYDLMKHCWDEAPEFRPTFSSLVVAVSNMLSDQYKKCLQQLIQNFQRESPAAVLFRRRFWRTSGDESGGHTDTLGGPVSEVMVHQLEGGLPHNVDICPLTVRTLLNGSSDSESDAFSPDPFTIFEPQEVTSSENWEPPAASCRSDEEEESCL